METSTTHTHDDSVNSSVLSARDMALRSSAPISVLLASMAIIFGCIFVIFIVWSRSRRTSYWTDKDSSPTNHLTTKEFGLDSSFQTGPNCVYAEQNCQLPPLRVEMEAPSSPKFIISAESEEEDETNNQDRPIELRHIVKKAKSSMGLMSNSPNSQLRVEVHQSTNITVESLTSAHRRQVDQRERFIHDRHNLGLRHLAISQIRNQQKTEKEIMRMRRAGIAQAVT